MHSYFRTHTSLELQNEIKGFVKKIFSFKQENDSRPQNGFNCCGFKNRGVRVARVKILEGCLSQGPKSWYQYHYQSKSIYISSIAISAILYRNYWPLFKFSTKLF